MVEPLNRPVLCGGVTVRAGDIVVADEEGIVAVPSDQAGPVLELAQAREAREAQESLDDWEAAHRSQVDGILAAHGFTG